jgi:site-specific recombinase XerD
LSEKDFHSIFDLNLNVRGGKKELVTYLFYLKDKAEKVIKKLAVFSFESFERKMFRKESELTSIGYQYQQKIKKLRDNEQIKTASSYEFSLASLIGFYKYHMNLTKGNFQLSEITPDFLQKYEKYMVNHLKRSLTTVGIYLRPLRAIFNEALSNGDIALGVYPFGKNGYKIPSVRKVKKALDKTELKTLFESIPKSLEQEKAKDFWFFSYSCNGMNIKDIALLKVENIESDKLIFIRAKTQNTAKEKLQPVVVYLTEYAKNVIQKYQSGNHSKDYLFPILSEKDTAQIKNNKTQNFVRFINQHIKKLAKDNGLSENISTYWARHSFATNAIRSGASMEFVSEALSHSNIKTTQGYFAGFDNAQKKDIAKSLMEF